MRINLYSEFKRRNLTYKEVSSFLGISPVTLSRKLNEKQDFTLKEALKILQLLDMNNYNDLWFLFYDLPF